MYSIAVGFAHPHSLFFLSFVSNCFLKIYNDDIHLFLFKIKMLPPGDWCPAVWCPSRKKLYHGILDFISRPVSFFPTTWANVKIRPQLYRL